MTKIWRVENSEGLGPYSVDWPYKEALQAAHHECCEHPSPATRIGNRDDPNFGFEFSGHALPDCKFGFPSKEHAKEWFDGWFEILYDGGFRLTEIEATNITMGASGRQLLFKPLEPIIKT